jgi:hypothetical protein
MSHPKPRVARTLLVVGVTLALALHAPAARALTAYGVTGSNQLLTFDTALPGTIIATAGITGLQVNEAILAIDVRPSTGLLYGLGSTSRLYVIDPATGAATQVGSATFAVPLNGTYFGFDFDPVTELIRVVSDAGQNLRLDPDAGAVVDSDPATPGVQPDTTLQDDLSIVGCAYSNNFPGAATTTLYGIDAATDSLVRIGGQDGVPPPESGSVTSIGLGLGVPFVFGGLDITTNGQQAYAVLGSLTGVTTHLYTVDLTLGNTTDLGMIGDGTLSIRDIAVLSRPVTLYGVTGANELVTFRSLQPNVILDTTPITGLQQNESILGIDVRPSTGRLYALGSKSILYLVDTTNGVAQPVGDPFEVLLDSAATAFGFNFNPVSERLRIVSNTGQNFRLDADTGMQVDSDPATEQIDLDVNLHPGTEAACAYTNDLPGARATTLFGINADSQKLVRQGGPNGTSPSPNGGSLNSIGSLNTPTFSATDPVGFDIAPVDGTAFFSLTLGSSASLYSVDLVSGAATLLGVIAAQPIRAITVAPIGRFEFADSNFDAHESDDSATITIVRLGGSNGPASVRVTTTDGTATAGLDYESVSTLVAFRDGETAQQVQIPLIDDALVEGQQTVHLTLSGPTTSLGTLTTALLTIEDDDSPPPQITCNTNADCDDHDRCTTDACTGGVCSNTLSPNFGTVLCELDNARRTSLCGNDPITKRLAKAIRQVISQTGGLVQQAARGKKRAARKADHLLASIQVKAIKAVKDVKITRPCGTAIEQRMQGIRDLLTASVR